MDSEGDSPAHPLPDFSIKVLQLSGLSLEVGSSSLDTVPLDQSIDGNTITYLYKLLLMPTPMHSECISLPQCHGVPIAMAGGRLSVKVKIKQSESEAGPKLEVDGYLSSLHMLLSPQQLAMLLEMATGLSSQGQGTLSLSTHFSPTIPHSLPHSPPLTLMLFPSSCISCVYLS